MHFRFSVYWPSGAGAAGAGSVGAGSVGAGSAGAGSAGADSVGAGVVSGAGADSAGAVSDELPVAGVVGSSPLLQPVNKAKPNKLTAITSLVFIDSLLKFIWLLIIFLTCKKPQADVHFTIKII